jgi:glc operon protein GlcG
MSGVKTDSGPRLNRVWHIGARECRYHKDGNWYKNLTKFPGALCDPDGYIIFRSKEEYLENRYLQIGEELHVPNGISSIPGYKKVQQISDTPNNHYEANKEIEIEKSLLYQIGLGNSEAELAIKVIKDELLKSKKAAVTVVADSHGELIALLRLDGAPLQSVTVAINKAYTAAREGKPTLDIGAKMRDPQKGYSIAYFGDPRYTGFPGGVPVIVDGQTVGAVAVSGLSGMEDMEFAQKGVEAILKAVGG